MLLLISKELTDRVVDLSEIGELFPDLDPDDETDLDNPEDVESFLLAKRPAIRELYAYIVQQADENEEEVRDDCDDDETHRGVKVAFLYFGDEESFRLFNKILLRLLQSLADKSKYIPVSEKPLSDSDSESEADQSKHSDTSDQESDESDLEEKAEPAKSSSHLAITLPPPKGTPEPFTTPAQLEEIYAKRTRASPEADKERTQAQAVRSNFIPPEKRQAFQGIEPVKLRPGVNLATLNTQSLQPVAFRNS